MRGLALFYLIIGLNDLENTAKNFVELEISERIRHSAFVEMVVT